MKRILIVISLLLMLAAPPFTTSSVIPSTPLARSTSVNVAPSQPQSQTPGGDQLFVNAEFFPNGSAKPTTFMTVNEGSPTRLDFRASSNVTITNALVNVTVPTLTLNYTGKTLFRGTIGSTAPALLTLNITALMPTEVTIGVVTSGTIASQTGGGSQSFRQPSYFLVNTTDWNDTIHSTPLPGDPYGSNATRIPMTNASTVGMAAGSPSQRMDLLPASTPTPKTTPFTVSGTIIFFDFEFGGFLPAHHVKVQVWSDDFCLCDHNRGTTFTDDFGFFSIGGVSTTSYHVSAFPEDDVAKVGPGCPFSDCDGAWFEFIAFQAGAPPVGPSINIGAKAPQGFNEAFMLHNAQLDVQRKLATFGFSQTWRQYSVFQSGGAFTPVTNIGAPPDGVNFFPSESNFAWGHVTMYHEYGHSIMERIYQLINWPCGLGCVTISPHSPQSSSGPGFAISEGWAEFVAALVQGSPNCGGCNNGGSMALNGFGNIETNTFLANSNPLTTNGNIVEGSVAAVFWDLTGSAAHNECYSTGGCDHIFGLLPFLIGSNKDDNSAEFHSAHRNSMLDVFTDILNGPNAIFGVTLENLCIVFVGNGLMPTQCQGVALTTLNAASLLLIAMIVTVTGVAMSKRPKREIEYSFNER